MQFPRKPGAPPQNEQNTNFDELMQLLGPRNAATAAAAAVPAAASAPTPATQRVPPSAAATAAAAAQRVHTASAASAAAAAQMQRQHIARQQQQQQQRQQLAQHQQRQQLAQQQQQHQKLAQQQQQRQKLAQQQQQRQKLAQQQQQRQKLAQQQQQRQKLAQQQQQRQKLAQQQQQRQKLAQQQQQRQKIAQQQQQRTSSITDELDAILGPHKHALPPRTQPGPAAPAVRRAPAAPNRAMFSNPAPGPSGEAARAAAAAGAGAGAPNARAAPALVPSGRTNTTQEQTIVIHFCRHALTSLTRLTSNLSNTLNIQQHLKHTIKQLLAEWGAKRITKATLLQTVAQIVRNSCPAAANVDVLLEFRTWYSQQVSAQRNLRRSVSSAGAASGHAPVPSATVGQPTQQLQQAPQVQQTYAYPDAPRNSAPVSAMQPSHTISNAPMAPAAPAHPSVAHRHVPPKPLPAKSIPQRPVVTNTMQRPVPKQQSQLVSQPSAQLHATQSPRKAKPAKSRPQPVARPKTSPTKQIKTEPNLASTGFLVKREPADITMGSTTTVKKPKPPAKNKASPKTKHPVVSSVRTSAIAAPRARAPPPRNNLAAVPTVGAAVSHAVRPGAAPGAVNIGARPLAVAAAPSADASKKRKGSDMLDVCGNIVDIDNEQSKLVDETMEMSDPGDADDYNTDMLLDGSTLKGKVERIMRKHGFTCGVSKETMEMLSLATRERISYVTENVCFVAAQRVDSEKAMWETRPHGPNVHELLEKMRDEEEHSLTLQAEMRSTKWRQAQEDKAAHEAAEKRPDEKSSKVAAAAAEQKKKAKVALEKKRAADSSQRSALSGAISGIGKKRKKSKHKPPSFLAPLSTSKNDSAKSSEGSSAITTPNAAGASSIPQVQTGTPATPTAPVQAVAVRPALTLQDCLHFMSGEHNMRQSALVYKWYARLGASHSRRQLSSRARR